MRNCIIPSLKVLMRLRRERENRIVIRKRALRDHDKCVML